jgi:transposase-like protein
MRRKQPPLFNGRHFDAAIIEPSFFPVPEASENRKYRNGKRARAERNLSVDHVTIWRWVQRYALELNRRCRPEIRRTNAAWRCDETYVGVAGSG